MKAQKQPNTLDKGRDPCIFYWKPKEPRQEKGRKCLFSWNINQPLEQCCKWSLVEGAGRVRYLKLHRTWQSHNIADGHRGTHSNCCGWQWDSIQSHVDSVVPLTGDILGGCGSCTPQSLPLCFSFPTKWSDFSISSYTKNTMYSWPHWSHELLYFFLWKKA